MRDEKTSDQDSLDVEQQRFSIVPEWLIEQPISDAAFRLYALLLRYGGSSGCRMPSRRTLAQRLHRSVDSVDRAMRELETAEVVVVERRLHGSRRLTNRYHVRTSEPGRGDAATGAASAAGRTPAAGGGRTGVDGGGRTSASSMAADLRPDPEQFTESTPTDPEELARRLREERRSLGLSASAWTGPAVARAMSRSRARGWPEDSLEAALLVVARDGASRSPLRVAEAGPWWDVISPVGDVTGATAACEAMLDALDGERVRYQQRARAELLAEGQPVTRATVVQRAALLAGLQPLVNGSAGTRAER